MCKIVIENVEYKTVEKNTHHKQRKRPPQHHLPKCTPLQNNYHLGAPLRYITKVIQR